MARRHRLATRAVGVTAVGALALAAVPAVAHAAAPKGLPVTYDAVGTSYVKKIDASVDLGPTTLNSVISGPGNITGTLLLPPKQVSFKELGFVPVTATVNFIPVGGDRQVTGMLTRVGNTSKVTSKARFIIRLSDVSLAGIPTFVGDSCQTTDTVVIPANTPKGAKFDLTNGGVLKGTYTIGQFQNCGLTTALVNQLVPGPGNTQTITLSNGRVTS